MAEGTQRHGHPNIVGVDKGIGPLEAQIVRAVAELGRPATVREVCDRLARGGYFAYQGILNCMNHLVGKGVLGRTTERAAYQYHLLVEPDELTAEVLASVVAHLGVDPDRAVCRLLHVDPDRGAAEVAKLRQRLQTSAGAAAVRPPRSRARS